MPSAQRRLVLGLCPEIFRPELDFLFVTVVAEFFNGFWIRRGTPEQAFPPKGDIYVPKEVFPDDFHAGEAAAWEVEDQPNYAERHLSCRYRAARLADPPLELVSLPWASTDPALRQHLQETGIAFVPRRSDRNALLEFSDGLIAKVRLEPKAGGGRLFIVPAADLANPLEAWPPDKLFSILTLESSRGSRCFCALPVPPAAMATLDLSTLEEALSAAKRAGGLGSTAALPPAELRSHLKRLEEAVQAFDSPAWQSRRKRLEQFLAQARAAVDERGKWEAFLTAHPVFRETLGAAIAKGQAELRQKVRAEILAEEEQLQQNLLRLGKEWEELEGVKTATESDVAKLRQELAGLKALRPVAAAVALPSRDGGGHVEGPSHDGSDNGVPTGRLLPEKRADDSKPAACTPLRNVSLPLSDRVDTLSTPAQALALLEKNFQALGIIRVSSRLLAREVLVAASLGQLLLFRGSLAGPVAEAAAVSLAGTEVRVVPVPLGATEPLPVFLEKETSAQAVVFEGINRSCLDAFGTPIQEQVRARALGLTEERLPILLSTLGEGPSCLPPGPHLFGFGPVFDTDLLSWDFRKDATTVAPGRAEAAVWALSEKNEGEEEWGEFLDELLPAPCLLWERSVRAAFRRLAALAERDRPNQPKWSLLFGWVLPRLLLSQGNLAPLEKHLTEGFLHGATSEDQRVRRVLQAHGVEVEQ